jgi:hypothetical protein
MHGNADTVDATLGEVAGEADLEEWVRRILQGAPIVRLPISLLRIEESPRCSGEDAGHTRTLAENDRLPPILVHEPTSRVIDGVHRVRAAQLRGESEIPAVLYEGGEQDAFVLAVRMNVSHGLPLARAERTAAAERILHTRSQWSDRLVASITGLSARTIGELRRRSSAGAAQSDTRFGRDGRLRPLSSAEGRRKAGRLLVERPSASLREVAREAGVSPSTVHDVRQRLLAGDDVVPTRQQRSSVAAARLPRRDVRMRTVPLPDPDVALAGLRKDPALRLSESGRALLRWLGRHGVRPADSQSFVESVPPHCIGVVARLARGYAKVWEDIATELEARRVDRGA